MMPLLGKPRSRPVFLGLMLAVALTLSLTEAAFLPPLGIPGAKWGLANIVSLLILMKLGFREALSLAAVRVLLVSLVSGTFLNLGFWLAMAGALVSVAVMALLLQAGIFGLLGISIFGAAMHNLAQLTVYGVLVGSAGVYYLLPPLLLASLLTGSLTGISVYHLRQY